MSMSPQGTQQKHPKPKTHAAGSNHVVVPAELPAEILTVFKQALRGDTVAKGLNHILKETSEEKTPTDLAENFLTRYEEQIMRLRGSVINNQAPAFRAALIVKCLEALPFFRVRFAEKGYNSLFLKTWLQKQLLATLMGIAERDVEAKIRHSGLTPPRFLDEQLSRLIPLTCLPKIR